MTEKITLTRGFEAIIDDEDFERVWMQVSGKGRHVYLHRFLLGFPEERHVKFINGDTLDCRRENLRAASRAEIHAERNLGPNNQSGFKGVSFNQASGKFKAYIKHHGKLHYLGLFPTAIEAARIYNEKARELRGSLAFQNNIPEDGRNI
jgi:hypothetical protein